MVLLLPQLEHVLRRLYAVVNDCSERVLTAKVSLRESYSSYWLIMK